MQETLTLADGTVLAGHVIEMAPRLYVYLDHSTLAEAFPVLNDPDRMAVVVARRYGEETVYTGYSHLTALSEEFGGQVDGTMVRQ